MSAVIKSNRLRIIESNRDFMVEPGDLAYALELQREATDPPQVRAKSIVEKAREEAEEMVSSARAEADGIRAAAYREGYDTARKAFDLERAEIVEHLADTLEDTRRQVDEFWITVEPEILKLAVDVARKVVHKEINESPDVVLNTVKIALYQIKDRQALKILVNPADYELLREHKEEIMGSCDGMRSLEIVEDRRTQQGGCLIEAENGNLDARIDTQLREVERALMEAAHDGRHNVAAETG